jgi:N-acetylglutamate synthase-like GNAT family acetyltransferase
MKRFRLRTIRPPKQSNLGAAKQHNWAQDSMNIRTANENDMTTLVDLIRRSFAEVAERENLNEADHPRCTSFYTKQRMQEDFEKGLQYFILEQHEKAIGCVAMEIGSPDVCYLMRLAVLPEYRKQNHGEKLVRYLLDQARQVGAKEVKIGILDNADRLKKWYEQLGFVQFKTQKYDHLPFLVASLSIDV